MSRLAVSAEAERWREARVGAHIFVVVEAGDALAAALEARDRRIAELEAGVERIAGLLPYGEGSTGRQIARDLLAGRAGPCPRCALIAGATVCAVCERDLAQDRALGG